MSEVRSMRPLVGLTANLNGQKAEFSRFRAEGSLTAYRIAAAAAQVGHDIAHKAVQLVRIGRALAACAARLSLHQTSSLSCLYVK